MASTPVIIIFDIGKTNKKLFLFDENYNVVFEESSCFDEIVDEDGDACEDLERLQKFVHTNLQKVLADKNFPIKAVNFSTYGASFVHVDKHGKPVTPLYNYLKAYPKELLNQFYDRYGGEHHFSLTTASPVLGHLNSGMQLYWLKYVKPQSFEMIKHSLHLPQFVSSMITGHFFSELTSIGCHTNLWDFTKKAYHDWVIEEGVISKLAPVISSTHLIDKTINAAQFRVGVGLHDSSAALIPYLASFNEPFLLISTGTWCISLNPFNDAFLSLEELRQDCLCYLTYEGRPVKASRLFAGNEHEQQVKRLASHFNQAKDYYKSIRFNIEMLPEASSQLSGAANEVKSSNIKDVQPFAQQGLSAFSTYEEAYYNLIQNIIVQQVQSTRLVLSKEVKRIFVDGGFSKNPVYMNLLASAFPGIEVFAASMAQATALGAALAIHSAWNSKHHPTDLIQLTYYGASQNA